MSFAAFFVLLQMFSLILEINALGINCRGSILCGYKRENQNILDIFYDAMTTGSNAFLQGGPLEDDRVYYNGQPQDVACWAEHNVCLFLQGRIESSGVNGSTIKQRLNDLRYHGCRICGSVPISGNNNPYYMGYLTSNYVTGGSCDGICPNVSRPAAVPTLKPYVQGPSHGG
ncbi:hypothetical protein MMC14_001681 [Varicellaria rhodocarpa]|nr:hypothetical protein [Varicellaria rhodocarpa]